MRWRWCHIIGGGNSRKIGIISNRCSVKQSWQIWLKASKQWRSKQRVPSFSRLFCVRSGFYTLPLLHSGFGRAFTWFDTKQLLVMNCAGSSVWQGTEKWSDSWLCDVVKSGKNRHLPFVFIPSWWRLLDCHSSTIRSFTVWLLCPVGEMRDADVLSSASKGLESAPSVSWVMFGILFRRG